jgi:hypothetical protein
MNTRQKAMFLSLLPRVPTFDAMQSRRAFKAAFGIDLDHHEFSYYLAELEQKGLVRRANVPSCDGFTVYQLAAGREAS